MNSKKEKELLKEKSTSVNFASVMTEKALLQDLFMNVESAEQRDQKMFILNNTLPH